MVKTGVPKEDFNLDEDLKHHIATIIRSKLGDAVADVPGVVDRMHQFVRNVLTEDGAEKVHHIAVDSICDIDTSDMVASKMFGDEVFTYRNPQDPPEIESNGVEVTLTSLHALVYTPSNGNINAFSWIRPKNEKGALVRIPFRVTMKGNSDPDAFMSFADYEAFSNPIDPGYVDFLKHLFDSNVTGELFVVFKTQVIYNRRIRKEKKFKLISQTKFESTEPYSRVHCIYSIPKDYKERMHVSDKISAEVADKIRNGMDPEDAIDETVRKYQAEMGGVMVNPHGDVRFVGTLPPRSELNKIVQDCPYPDFIKEKIKEAYERKAYEVGKEAESEVNEVLVENNRKIRRVKKFISMIRETSRKWGIDEKMVNEGIREINTLTKSPEVMKWLNRLTFVTDTNFSEIPLTIKDVISDDYNRVCTEYQAFSGNEETHATVNIEKDDDSLSKEPSSNSITNFLRGQENPTFHCVMLEAIKGGGRNEYNVTFYLFSHKIVSYMKKEIED